MSRIFSKENKINVQQAHQEQEMYARLQLAESYVEIGEIEEANSVLKKVLLCGNKNEQKIARTLLSRIKQLQTEYT